MWSVFWQGEQEVRVLDSEGRDQVFATPRRVFRYSRNRVFASGRTRSLRRSESERFRSWGNGVFYERRHAVIEAHRVHEDNRSRVGRLSRSYFRHSDTRRISKDAHAAMCLAAAVRCWQPQSVLELGTGFGISGAYMAKALPAGGRLMTVDWSEERLHAARTLFDSLGVDDRVTTVPGSFDDSLPDVLRQIGKVDLAFVDGNHTYAATIRYVESILRHSTGGALIILDDINYDDAMAAAWAELSASTLFEATVSLRDMGAMLVR